MTNPSVFLSYSHDSVAHKAWVRKLAEDLRGQGVDATLDQWNDSSPHCGGGAGSNQQPATSSQQLTAANPQPLAPQRRHLGPD